MAHGEGTDSNRLLFGEFSACCARLLSVLADRMAWAGATKGVMEMLLSIYLCGWLLTAVAIFAVADSYANLPDNRLAPSATTYGALAVAAGALWPALIAGVVELVCVQAAAHVIKAAKRSTAHQDGLLARR